ncbi:hypothetical protein V6N13_102519 [Hibiscus sabdariffa]
MYRNAVVFEQLVEDHRSIIERSRYLQALMVGAQVRPANATVAGTRVQQLQARSSPPAYGWYQLNSDDARRVDDGKAACEGLIRDSAGTWIIGFAKALGVCSVVDVEL